MHLAWDGLENGRDLGGLRSANGAVIVPGRLARSASPHTLTAEGWHQLHASGVRTIVNLMTDVETGEREIRCPEAVSPDVEFVRSSLEPDRYALDWLERGEGWKLSTPHYYDDFVSRYPERLAATLEAVAFAGGRDDRRGTGVLVHCRAGRDRCGLAIAMILDLIGIDHAAIVADHWRSFVGPDEETALGAVTSAELRDGRELSSSEHSDTIHRVLVECPAETCFATQRDADAARTALLDRLCDR